MRNFTRKLIKKHAAGLVLTAVFSATFAVCLNVRFYGDDFFYATFTQHKTAYFVSHHIEHYFRANGRVVVHLLDTLFLAANPIFWRIINPLMLCAIVFFGAKTAAFENNGRLSAPPFRTAVMAACVFFLNIRITRQSVYWVTGSFNYVYPMAILLVYWYFLNRGYLDGRHTAALPVIAFFSAATVEQAGVMSFGLTLAYVFYTIFVKGEKPGRVLVFSLAAALTGVLTVICSPAVLYRSAMEAANNGGIAFPALFKSNIWIQGKCLFFSYETLPYHLMALVPALMTIARESSPKGGSGRKAIWTAVGLLSAGIILWAVLVGIEGTGFASTPGGFLVCSFAAAGVPLTLLYAAIIEYRGHEPPKSIVPVSALILGYGSQLMMIVSHAYGPRNQLYLIFMLGLYTAALLPDPRTVRPGLFRGLFAGACIIAAVWSCTVIAGTAAGYAANAGGYDENAALARKHPEYRPQESLVQYKLKDDLYGWAMPYHNPYYDPYYKSFLGVGSGTDIVWKQAGG